MIPRELLNNGAIKLGIPLTVEQANSVFIYLAELKKWSRKINLTAIKDERDIIIKHVLDSLSYIHGFTPAPGLRLLDMGSGAGFPALPIKIVCPGIVVTMVESTKKKASFLRHIIRTLKLTETAVVDSRTEELDVHFLSAFDIVTARAFADMKSAIAEGMPLLRPGGLIVLSRGPEETINEQDLARAGVSLERRTDLTLPFSDYKRTIWVFKKAG
ncbi:MAG: 16S rRNA (guanine(527)-N(7))-methyltransferase RsmG [Nitrospirae bacterium]|nr:16S rRNA (guanine(527)-N(7))-methyltransferase RsmG [Nitrospirota bacterium]